MGAREPWTRKYRSLSHETALAVYGISDMNPSQVHITVPKGARLRRQRPKWIVIHRGDLPPTDVTTHEGLPVTTVAKSVLHVANETGRLGLARQAIKDARKEGHISAAEAKRRTRQLNEHHGGDGRTQGAKEHPTA
jgi:predicted transcriptional regulator of viral defense system